MMNNNKHYAQYIPLIVSVLVFVAFSYFFFHQIGDDSYIYFRYVERALTGHWWSWSNHIPPVEGYSSPLWYFLLILMGKLQIPVLFSAQILGFLFSLLTVIGAWCLSRELKASVFFAGIACLLLVMNHGFHYWSTSGLETSLYAALFVWSCVGIVRERYWLLPTALIGVARPEGVFLLPAILLAIFIVKRHTISVFALLMCFAPTIFWLFLRYSIYGEWLPNTFFVKATGDVLDQIVKGVLYCLPALLPLLLLWVYWFSFKKQAEMIVLGMSTMLLGIILLGGGDWMFHFRLLIPLYALILALAVSQWQQVSNFKRALLVVVFIPFLLTIVPVKYYPSVIQAKQLPLKDYQEGAMTMVSINLAKIIKTRFPEAKLIAVNHAGALPWALPEYDVIDMVGLNDAHIAKVEGQLHHKFDADYVLKQKPDLIILNSRTKPKENYVFYHKGYWSGEDALVEHPEFAHYEPTQWYAQWGWSVPYPYSLVVKNAETSWIMVYQRKPL